MRPSYPANSNIFTCIKAHPLTTMPLTPPFSADNDAADTPMGADNDTDDTPMNADKHPQMIRIQGPNIADTPFKCYVSTSPQPSMTMTALTAG